LLVSGPGLQNWRLTPGGRHGRASIRVPRARQQFVFVSVKALRSATLPRVSCIRVDAPIVRRKTFT
jgi:hypothetical protein